MKTRRPLTPAAEKLREYIRSLYAPIEHREPTEAELLFDSLKQVMPFTPSTFHTASTLARELSVSVMTITRLVHRGVIRPGRTPSGTMLFSASDIETIKNHLTK